MLILKPDAPHSVLPAQTGGGLPPYYVDNRSRRDGAISLTLHAAQQGHIEVVRALLAAGANINHADAEEATSLMMSARNGHIEVVRALLAANADPRIVAPNGATSLSVAKAKKRTAIAALLEARLAELAAAGSA